MAWSLTLWCVCRESARRRPAAATQIAAKGGRHRDVAGSRRRGQCYFHDAIDALLLDGTHAQVAYFGWYQMHASKQSRNMKEYYEQNPTTGEEIGQ